MENSEKSNISDIRVKKLKKMLLVSKLIKVISSIFLTIDLLFLCFSVYALYKKIFNGIIPIAVTAAAAVVFIVLINVFSKKREKYAEERNLLEQAKMLEEKREHRRIVRASMPSYIDLNAFIKEVHPDIQKLIITHDNIENYTPKIMSEYLSTITEPSLIDDRLEVNLNITPPKDSGRKVQQSFSSLSYERLTPDQRGMYLNFLKNPYEFVPDMRYVTILFYGLERHIAYGESGLAAEVIDKLRGIYTEKNFAIPAFNAMFYFSKRNNMLKEFLKGEYYSLNLDFNIYYGLKTNKIFPTEAMIRFKKYFDFPEDAKDINPLLFQREVNRLLGFDEREWDEKIVQGYWMGKFPVGHILSDMENLPFPSNYSMDRIVGKYSALKHLYDVEPFRSDIADLLKRAYLNLVKGDRSFNNPR